MKEKEQKKTCFRISIFMQFYPFAILSSDMDFNPGREGLDLPANSKIINVPNYPLAGDVIKGIKMNFCLMSSVY